MTGLNAQGGQDVAWGARTFVRYDHLPVSPSKSSHYDLHLH